MADACAPLAPLPARATVTLVARAISSSPASSRSCCKTSSGPRFGIRCPRLRRSARPAPRRAGAACASCADRRPGRTRSRLDRLAALNHVRRLAHKDGIRGLRAPRRTELLGVSDRLALDVPQTTSGSPLGRSTRLHLTHHGEAPPLDTRETLENGVESSFASNSFGSSSRKRPPLANRRPY
jgi:hypothetical protein